MSNLQFTHFSQIRKKNVVICENGTVKFKIFQFQVCTCNTYKLIRSRVYTYRNLIHEASETVFLLLSSRTV